MAEDESKKGFAVQPKLDCPHLKEEDIAALLEMIETNQFDFSGFTCAVCKDKEENWICLQCRQIGCSRYVKGHMAEHNTQHQHPVALSFSDGSYWCYSCQSYIDSPSLQKARAILSNSKHGKSEKKPQPAEDLDQLSKKMEELHVQEDKAKAALTLDVLVEGIKAKKYSKVVFLTGAGLSVAAGIPDFRTPGTGLYSKLEKYNLPAPEAIFSLQFFKSNPIPFISLAKQVFAGKFEPTLGHKFIAEVQKHGMLLMNLTQNIDDLELLAGVSEDKLLQAHGHSRSAHCIVCKKQVPIVSWTAALQKQQCLKCECGGLVKPDIVFFGQQLPAKFFTAPDIVRQADLVFIIGTSLKVMPFAFLVQLIAKDAPVVLINFDDSLTQRNDKLWMKGDIQNNVKILMEALGW